MTTDMIEPLDEEDWNKLVAVLDEGQTEKQKKIMEEARRIGEIFRIPE